MEKFEEYKLLNERAQKLSERRQTTSQTYLTIITAIFGASAFLITDSALHHWALVLAAIPMFCIGILVCTLWLNIMTKLETFLDWQYDRLREMEKDLPGSFMILTKENKRFYEPKKDEKRFSFTLQEAWLPRLLMILFGLYAIGLIVSAILGWV
jgi:ABC-type dipeptide/oligopeptide/nickel transport system permease component